MVYIPTNPPPVKTVDDLLDYVQDELVQIAAEFSETTVLELRPSYAAPTKPRTGMLVYADGTSWNPGSGAGVYVYTGSAWSRL